MELLISFMDFIRASMGVFGRYIYYQLLGNSASFLDDHPYDDVKNAHNPPGLAQSKKNMLMEKS
jgi:hypothetical protein